MQKIVCALLALVLCFSLACPAFAAVESPANNGKPSDVIGNQDEEFGVTKKTITKDGVDYFPRQDIVVILVMGIDQDGPVKATKSNNGNAVDMAALMVFDEKNETCTILNINRDAMVDMPVLNERGLEDGVFNGQLAYSHTYGTGLEDSCENTRKTVSNLFNGITVDYYVAMNLDAVAKLNDAVGGVTVNVADDFSRVDKTISKGNVTLKGEQATNYVRARWFVGDELNLSRMERQNEYMSNFVDAFKAKAKDGTDFVVPAYEKVAQYLVSDMPISTLTSMMERYANYSFSEIVSLEGENVLGEQYYEFHLDEEKLEDLTLQMFYAPKE